MEVIGNADDVITFTLLMGCKRVNTAARFALLTEAVMPRIVKGMIRTVSVCAGATEGRKYRKVESASPALRPVLSSNTIDTPMPGLILSAGKVATKALLKESMEIDFGIVLGPERL